MALLISQINLICHITFKDNKTGTIHNATYLIPVLHVFRLCEVKLNSKDNINL